MNLPCVACRGTCCKGHKGVPLDDGTLLLFVNGQCPHLNEDGLCGIYETRPQICREWDCSKEERFLFWNPRVAALLTIGAT